MKGEILEVVDATGKWFQVRTPAGVTGVCLKLKFGNVSELILALDCPLQLPGPALRLK